MSTHLSSGTAMQLNFLHPRTSAIYQAEVDPHTTGQVCINGLIDANFIPPPRPGVPYSLLLSRTNRQVAGNTTMQEAGVMNGDNLAVEMMEQGADHRSSRC